MALFRNDAKGTRAILLQGRSLLFVDPGETVDVSIAEVKGVTPGIVRVDEPEPPKQPDRRAIVEAMPDDELRAFVEKLTGKRPHPRTKRDTLIERALDHG